MNLLYESLVGMVVMIGNYVKLIMMGDLGIKWRYFGCKGSYVEFYFMMLFWRDGVGRFIIVVDGDFLSYNRLLSVKEF